MIRIRVEVLATKPIVVKADTTWGQRSTSGSLEFVQATTSRWIAEFALSVRRAADELVPR